MSRFRAPKAPPALSFMLSDLGQPRPRELARFLGVHERTVYGWQARDSAPRPVALALFWETSIGRNWLAVNAENEARLWASRVACLETDNARLRARVAYLEQIGRFDSANAPTFAPSHTPPDDGRPRLLIA